MQKLKKKQKTNKLLFLKKIVTDMSAEIKIDKHFTVKLGKTYKYLSQSNLRRKLNPL